MANLTCNNLNNDGVHCNVDWHRVSNWEYTNYCNFNYGTACDKNRYITTASIVILNKKPNDPVFESIGFLRDEYLEKDKNYNDLLEMYDYIGPQIAKKMDEDENRVKTASKVYSILNRISKLVEKEEIAKATRYYSQMVGVLINKYDLGEFYEEYEENKEKDELAEKTVKKHKIGPKTLD